MSHPIHGTGVVGSGDSDRVLSVEAIARIARKSFKPILCCFMGVIDVSPGVKYLQKHGYPVYQFPENAAKAMGALYRYAGWLNRIELPDSPVAHDRAREFVGSWDVSCTPRNGPVLSSAQCF